MFDISKFRFPFREDKVFSILSFMVLVIPLSFSVFSNENFETIKYSLWLVLLGWALFQFFWEIRGGKKKPPLKTNKAVFWVAVFMWVFAALSTLMSLDFFYSIFGFYYRFTNSLVFYTVWILFFLLLLARLDRQRLVFLLKILAFDSLLIAAVGFLQSLGISYYEGLETKGFIRAPSLLGNPNFSSMFLVAVLPYVMVLLARAGSFPKRVYYGLTVFSIILTTVVLASRGALLGLAAGLVSGLVLAVVFRFGKKFLKAILWSGAAVILGFLIILVSRPDIVSPAFNAQDDNVRFRLAVWDLSIKGMQKQPLLGSGPGTYALFFERARDKDMAGEIGIFDDAHNLFLHVGTTTGIPFLAGLLGLMALSAYYGLREVKGGRDPLALAGLAALVIFAASASFTPVSIPCFLLLAIIIAGLVLESAREREVLLSWQARLPAAVLGLVLAIAGTSFLAGEHLLTRAFQSYFAGDYQKSLALSSWALKLNPTNRLSYIYRAGSEIMLGATGEEVLAQIGRVERLHPGQARSYSSAANLYYLLYERTGRPEFLDMAAKKLETSLKIDPYYSDRYGQLGLYYFLTADYAKAKETLAYGLDINGRNFSSLVLLAKIYQQENDRDSALAALEQAYKLNPMSAQMQFLLKAARSEPDITKVPIQITLAKGSLD